MHAAGIKNLYCSRLLNGLAKLHNAALASHVRSHLQLIVAEEDTLLPKLSIWRGLQAEQDWAQAMQMAEERTLERQHAR